MDHLRTVDYNQPNTGFDLCSTTATTGRNERSKKKATKKRSKSGAKVSMADARLVQEYGLQYVGAQFASTSSSLDEYPRDIPELDTNLCMNEMDNHSCNASQS
ncbi:hypothetical protein E8E14_006094 [Neopestalotiopsis sp. 37M]|nr:hypothetical protein E8E14_006094 [Neopestalotiopsis sp. 37M]